MAPLKRFGHILVTKAIAALVQGYAFPTALQISPEGYVRADAQQFLWNKALDAEMRASPTAPSCRGRPRLCTNDAPGRALTGYSRHLRPPASGRRMVRPRLDAPGRRFLASPSGLRRGVRDAGFPAPAAQPHGHRIAHANGRRDAGEFFTAGPFKDATAPAPAED